MTCTVFTVPHTGNPGIRSDQVEWLAEAPSGRQYGLCAFRNSRGEVTSWRGVFYDPANGDGGFCRPSVSRSEGYREAVRRLRAFAEADKPYED